MNGILSTVIFGKYQQRFDKEKFENLRKKMIYVCWNQWPKDYLLVAEETSETFKSKTKSENLKKNYRTIYNNTMKLHSCIRDYSKSLTYRPVVYNNINQL